VGHRVRQAPGILFGYLSSMVRLHKLALKKGNSLSEMMCPPRVEDSVVVPFASILDTLSWTSLPARVARASTSLTSSMALFRVVVAFWAEAYAVHATSTWVTSRARFTSSYGIGMPVVPWDRSYRGKTKGM
jgi:hypothetical protein